MECFYPDIRYFVCKDCPSSWQLKPARIDFHDITFVWEGTATYFCDGMPLEVSGGEAVYLPVGSVRTASTAGMRCSAFNFLLPYAACAALPLPAKFSFHRLDSISEWLHQVKKEWYSDRQYRQEQSSALFLQILLQLLRHFSGPQENRYVRQIKEYIAANLTEPLTVKQIAGQCGLNPVYCGALFRREQGCTLLQYVQRKRIAQGANLLQYENCSVEEAARRSGFDNPFYFSKLFKQIKGVPPLTYKKHCR